MENLEQKKASLWDLQSALLRCEDEINSTEELEQLIGQIADKVDGIKMVIDILNADAVRLGDYAKDMTAKKKAAEASAERLKQYVTSSLIGHDTSFEVGHQWKVQLTSHEKVTLENDATIDDLFEFGSEIVKTSYEWNKTALKKRLEAGDENAKKVARIEKTNSIKFSANTMRNGKK